MAPIIPPLSSTHLLLLPLPLLSPVEKGSDVIAPSAKPYEKQKARKERTIFYDCLYL